MRTQVLCSCCRGAPPVNNQAYCAFCRNWVARCTRKPYREFTPEQKRKADVNSFKSRLRRRAA